MRNRLIPVVSNVTVWVVSVKDGGDRVPLAVFHTKQDALQSAKLIGMNNPELRPQYQPAWMPKRKTRKSKSK